MVLYLTNLWAEVLLFCITAITIVITYFQWKYTYWQRKKVPYLEPTIPFGNAGNLINRKVNFGVQIESLYKQLKAKGHTKYGGIYTFTLPRLLVMDPELVRDVMAKNFNHFTDRGFYLNEKDDPITANLLNLEGQRWKTLRQKLTPTFTSGKLKQMFQTLVDCSDELVVTMDELVNSAEPLNIKDILGRFTTDIIGSCAFGIDCNSLKDPNVEFRLKSQKIFELSKIELLKRVFMLSNRKLSQFLGLVDTNKETSAFFHKLVTETMEYRVTNNVTRKDFFQLLLDIKYSSTGNPESSLTDNEITAQSVLFFAAGFETSSTTMTFALYLLATHSDIQDKVREEIRQVLENHAGKITYDSMAELNYMQQVIDETLRLFPPLAVLHRVCTLEYQIPGSEVTLPVGQAIAIPVYAMQRDAEHYPDPEKFDPERFSEENKKNRHPYLYLPFGEGPRQCIGIRLGLMQTKVGLAVLLKNYRFTMNSKTIMPVRMDPNTFILSTFGGIWLSAEKI